MGSVDGARLSYTDTSLPAGPHSFTVRAIDAAGNLSDPSNTATATVPDTDKPSAPSNLAGTGSPGQVALTWDASTDNVGVTGYRVYRNGTQIASVLGNVTTFTDSGLTAGPRSYTVRAVDAAGQPLRREQHRDGDRARQHEADRPATCGRPRARPGVAVERSTDNVGVTGYRIYRGGTEVASLGLSVLHGHDVVGRSATRARLRRAGNLSDASNTATATVADTVKPTAPSS